MKRKFVISAAVAALLAGGTVTAVAASADDKPVKPKISSSDAVNTALKERSGTVGSVSLDDGVWEIEIADGKDKGHEVRVDAKNGEVVGVERDDRDDADDAADRDDVPAQGTKVDAERAASAAVALQAGTVTDVEFEDGRWEVEVRAEDGTEHDVHVDATTGKASAAPADDADDTDDDDRDND
ncbi:PepSY domain-containing protein [Streptomyces clavuligerus]|uniref:PepSY domain-containing protein n=1 Tax=Streptomyces clavuligerus TaxID=1901 RepID=B5GL13_STRCL|nr:PepSY domain-containing protein [Streptomyces clavuligerus]ANW18037.1 hypothetical protein BB341_07280 [Streptomyces clavuligerus]AXU12597.1 hypothetical protein D1794_07560 [Streptomyces clavuligerus]EDY47009.1 hypothetical protein SSCG_00037 [Streptomyces clavuligerus]EFG09385.1 Hypothetical protein SCLAV_4311 [Streptomyces clavuligerus]MBY6302497.1 PepSY domain-containing protein [Streptomyces clavuligerus]